MNDWRLKSEYAKMIGSNWKMIEKMIGSLHEWLRAIIYGWLGGFGIM